MVQRNGNFVQIRSYRHVIDEFPVHLEMRVGNNDLKSCGGSDDENKKYK